MGNFKTNPYIPFQMTYVYDAAEEWGDEPWNAKTKNCSEAYDVSARGIISSLMSRIKRTSKRIYSLS